MTRLWATVRRFGIPWLALQSSAWQVCTLLRAAGGQTLGQLPLCLGRWAHLPAPPTPDHLHRGARSAAEREDGRGRGGGARARPDSSALLAHSLVPGFRAQHGGQGDSNSLLLPLLHKRHSGDPACRPSPPPISFFAWVLDSVSSGSSSRVGELCGAWTGERGCPAGGGERGGIVSWRGLWGPRVGEGRVVSCSKCIVSLELEGIGKGVRGSGM